MDNDTKHRKKKCDDSTDDDMKHKKKNQKYHNSSDDDEQQKSKGKGKGTKVHLTCFAQNFGLNIMPQTVQITHHHLHNNDIYFAETGFIQ